MMHSSGPGLRPCRVALLIADGMKAESMAMVQYGLAEAEAIPLLLGMGRQTVRSADGQEFPPDRTLDNSPSEIFDALVLPDGAEAVDQLARDGRALEFLKDQYRHRKTILALGASSKLLEKAGIRKNFAAGELDPGIVLAGATATDVVAPLLAAMAKQQQAQRHR
jgi:catalase